MSSPWDQVEADWVQTRGLPWPHDTGMVPIAQRGVVRLFGGVSALCIVVVLTGLLLRWLKLDGASAVGLEMVVKAWLFVLPVTLLLFAGGMYRRLTDRRRLQRAITSLEEQILALPDDQPCERLRLWSMIARARGLIAEVPSGFDVAWWISTTGPDGPRMVVLPMAADVQKFREAAANVDVNEEENLSDLTAAGQWLPWVVVAFMIAGLFVAASLLTGRGVSGLGQLACMMWLMAPLLTWVVASRWLRAFRLPTIVSVGQVVGGERWGWRWAWGRGWRWRSGSSTFRRQDSVVILLTGDTGLPTSISVVNQHQQRLWIPFDTAALQRNSAMAVTALAVRWAAGRRKIASA